MCCSANACLPNPSIHYTPQHCLDRLHAYAPQPHAIHTLRYCGPVAPLPPACVSSSTGVSADMNATPTTIAATTLLLQRGLLQAARTPPAAPPAELQAPGPFKHALQCAWPELSTGPTPLGAVLNDRPAALLHILLTLQAAACECWRRSCWAVHRNHCSLCSHRNGMQTLAHARFFRARPLP
jgi:hypothetical protein